MADDGAQICRNCTKSAASSVVIEYPNTIFPSIRPIATKSELGCRVVSDKVTRYRFLVNLNRKSHRARERRQIKFLNHAATCYCCCWASSSSPNIVHYEPFPRKKHNRCSIRIKWPVQVIIIFSGPNIHRCTASTGLRKLIRNGRLDCCL